jgi:16S rRNA (cytosine1402-N4)-methyltransferase
VAAVCEAILAGIPAHHRQRTLARVFQALRILVNDELNQIDLGLEAAASSLRTGGVLCALAYHSLEDRKVKEFLRSPAPPRRDLPPPPGWAVARFDLLTRRAIRPSPAEVEANPRARSARLRAGVRRRTNEGGK